VQVLVEAPGVRSLKDIDALRSLLCPVPPQDFSSPAPALSEESLASVASSAAPSLPATICPDFQKSTKRSRVTGGEEWLGTGRGGRRGSTGARSSK
jgi:hypothetical protein